MGNLRGVFFSLAISLSTVCFAADFQEISCPKDTLFQTTAQYIFIGEDHRDYEALYFLTSALPILKTQGFDYFFAEYIDSSNQKYLDINSNNYVESIAHTFLDWGYSHQKYIEITKSVHRSKYKIIALDRRKDIRHLFPDKAKLALRDEHMFYLANDFINQNLEAKIIFFNGSSHSYVTKNNEGPSFYELFINTYGTDKTLNIKVDYYDAYSISLERLELSKLNSGVFNIGCDSGSFLYRSKKLKAFDYTLFEDFKKALPPIQSGGSFVR